jgi:hypothetical protein
MESEKSQCVPPISEKCQKISNSRSEDSTSHYDILPERESIFRINLFCKIYLKRDINIFFVFLAQIYIFKTISIIFKLGSEYRWYHGIAGV